MPVTLPAAAPRPLLVLPPRRVLPVRLVPPPRPRPLVVAARPLPVQPPRPPAQQLALEPPQLPSHVWPLRLPPRPPQPPWHHGNQPHSVWACRSPAGLDRTACCSGTYPAVGPRRGLPLPSLRRRPVVPAGPPGKVHHLRVADELPHGLVRRLPVRPLIEQLLGQIVAVCLGLGGRIRQIIAVPIFLAHACRQGLLQGTVAGPPLDGPAKLCPERLPHLDPQVGICAFAELLPGNAAVLDPGALPLDPLTVREDGSRLSPVENLHDGCQLGSANRLLSRARPCTAPPNTCAAACYRPSRDTDLRKPRPQAAAIGVISSAAGQLHRCISREPFPPSHDSWELDRNAM